MTIFVLGAGPLGEVPQTSARLIIAVNEGVFSLHSLQSRSTKIWALVPAKDLTAQANYNQRKLQEMLTTSSPYERLLVRDNLDIPAKVSAKNSFSQSLAKDVRPVDYKSMARMWLSYFSLLEILRLNVRQNLGSGPIKQIVSFLGWKRLLSGPLLKASSGAIGLLLAIEEAESDEKVYVLGVTAARNSYAHPYFPAPRTGMHIDSDLILFRRLMASDLGSRIIFADPDLRTLVSP